MLLQALSIPAAPESVTPSSLQQSHWEEPFPWRTPELSQLIPSDLPAKRRQIGRDFEGAEIHQGHDLQPGRAHLQAGAADGQDRGLTGPSPGTSQLPVQPAAACSIPVRAFLFS